ncbi:hypothetical protein DFH06DRAFT_1337028 [Mycena polygramma]|nr:hypothetical protein DFH06DRAFT_1337028 [Mycena polygramma]
MFPTTTTATATANSRRHPQRRFSVDLLFDALPTALAPKRPRCASLPTPHRPTAVPRKSALKCPRALSEGDIGCHTQSATVLADDVKQSLNDEVKLALSLEDRLARDSTLDNMIDTMSAHVPRTVRKLFKGTSSRAYWHSQDEHRGSAVRRNSNLPPPVEWDEVAVTFQSEDESDSDLHSDSEDSEAPASPSTPRTVRFRVPAPPAPTPEPKYDEPAWSDFMVLIPHVNVALRALVFVLIIISDAPPMYYLYYFPQTLYTTWTIPTLYNLYPEYIFP